MLHARGLQVAYGAQEIFRDVDLDLAGGEALAIAGPNGAGKSTLLHCLAGALAPDAGSIQREAEIALLRQDPVDADVPVLEHLLSAMPPVAATFRRIAAAAPGSMEYAEAVATHAELGGYQMEAEVARYLAELGFDDLDPQRPCRSLSQGQRQSLGILRLLLTPARILALDEPTNHLDIAGRMRLEALLRAEKRRGRGFLIVSHDRVFLDRIADRTLYLDRGQAVHTSGGYTTMRAHLSRERQAREERAREIERRIRKLEAEAARKQSWASRKEKEKSGSMDKGFVGARAARLAKRAKVAQRRREALIEAHRAEKPMAERHLRLSFPPYQVANRRAFSIQGVSKAFGGHPLFTDVSLTVTTEERIGLVGPNGCGKTTLLRCILQELPPDTGEVSWNPGVRVVYFPQDIRRYFARDLLLDNLMGHGVEEHVVRQLLGAALIRRDKAIQPVDTLSRGELMRAAIVDAILARAELLLLDEPTNHLDIESLEVLDALLDEFPGGMLFVSHDRHFVAANARTLYGIEDGRLQLRNL